MIEKITKRKINRIALIGSHKSIRNRLAILLSEQLNIKQVSTELHNPNEINNVSERMPYNDMGQMIKGLSYFHKSIKLEKNEKSFISNGSVLNGYLLIRAMSLYQSDKKQLSFSIYNKFEERLLKIIGDYMKKTYDQIYFIPNSQLKEMDNNSYDMIFENIFYNSSKKIGLKFHVIQGDMEFSINQIQEQQEIA